MPVRKSSQFLPAALKTKLHKSCTGRPQPFGNKLHGQKENPRKRFVFKDFRLAPQVRLELTTLRLTAECSAIELLRIIHLSPLRPLAASASEPSFQRNLCALPLLAFPWPRTPLQIASPSFKAFTLPPRLSPALPSPFSLIIGSGKNFRFPRSLWIPATSYSPRPFPA